MKTRMTAAIAILLMTASLGWAEESLPAEQSFDQTDGVLESNWIPTGEDFFLLFRLYGPESKDFYKTWMLGDLERIG